MRSTFANLLCATALLGASARADVISIDLSQGDSIQATIDAAAPGDTILVQGHNSSTAETAVINGKGLTIIGDLPGSDPSFRLRRMAIRNLPAGQTVTIMQMKVSGPGAEALILTNNDGPVRLIGVSATGGMGLPFNTTSDGYPGYAGATVQNCDDVGFVRCGLIGGHGGDVASGLGTATTQGGPGLEAIGSTVTLFGSGVRGGRGGESGFIFSPHGGPGGPGATVQDSHLRLHNCIVEGGDGGEYDWGSSGLVLGGDGLVQSGASSTTVRDSALVGGEGYFADDGQPQVILGGQVHDYPSAMGRLAFVGHHAVREGQPITLQAQDMPAGTQMFVLLSIEPGQLSLPGREGVLLLTAPFASDLLLLGTSPAPTFTNTFNLGPAPNLPVSLQAVNIMVQCIELPAGGSAVLSEPDLLTLLDSEV